MKNPSGIEPGPAWPRHAPALRAALLAACAALSACGASPKPAHTAGNPPPATNAQTKEIPVDSSAPDAGIVKESFVELYAPLPAGVPEHPAQCDWIGYLRFRHADGPSDPQQADAVLVAQPGNLAGAGHLDIIARNVILNAAEKGKHVEFWALDRRSNCLEDHHGLAVARARGDYRLAIDYYFNGKELDGQKFEGFKTSADLGWLSEIGIKQTVEDQYTVITRGLPDPAFRKKKVFCGGHSLGGVITANFASWDFDGDPSTDADAGYNQCAGYFALETVVSNVAPLGVLSPVTGPLTPPAYLAVVAALRAGVLPRIETAASPLTPQTTFLITLAGLAATQAPEAESELFKLLPRDSNFNTAIRLLYSRDALAFAGGTPDIRDFRFTNEALFGLLVDDNSQALGFVAASVGTFDGGPVAEKTFPTPGVLTSTLGSIIPSGFLLTPNTLMIPTDSAALYTWRNFDKVAEPYAIPQRDMLGRPFTTPESEVTDIRQWARAVHEAPADLTEWYFPTRLTLDTLFTMAGIRAGDLANLRYEDGPSRHPTITLLGGESAAPLLSSDPQLGAPPNQLLVLPGYNHPDPTSAARTQHDGSREKGSQALTDFVLAIAGSAT